MKISKRFGVGFALIVGLCALGSQHVRAQVTEVGAVNDSLLETLNREFRVQYKQALADSIAHAGPIILEEGNDLVLLRDGVRTTARVKPVAYHELKAVAHVPLALFVMMSFPAETTLSSGRINTLRHYRQLMETAYKSLPSRHFNSEQLQRQEKIFRASFEVLNGALAQGRVDPAALEDFTRQVGPLLLANVSDATALEMNGLYATTANWKKQLTPAEWNSLHFVMIGPHMPRDQECSMQFFERLFAEPAEGKRIIYAEALWEEKDALNLLATHEVDEAAGAAFFGDPMRMHRDLLADAATAYLDTHPIIP